jgi:hypothetical protein
MGGWLTNPPLGNLQWPSSGVAPLGPNVHLGTHNTTVQQGLYLVGWLKTRIGSTDHNRSWQTVLARCFRFYFASPSTGEYCIVLPGVWSLMKNVFGAVCFRKPRAVLWHIRRTQKPFLAPTLQVKSITNPQSAKPTLRTPQPSKTCKHAGFDSMRQVEISPPKILPSVRGPTKTSAVWCVTEKEGAQTVPSHSNCPLYQWTQNFNIQFTLTSFDINQSTFNFWKKTLIGSTWLPIS